MAAMVVWFIFAMVVVWFWRLVVEKTEMSSFSKR